MTEPPTPVRSGRQKRPRVPDSLRKRAAQACLPCRQHKEKCGGGDPCTRCQHYQRICRFENAPPRQPSGNATLMSGASAGGWTARELQMKRIVTHFLGDISFEVSDLEEAADTLDQSHDKPANSVVHEPEFTNYYALDPLSSSTMHYSGELSHWNFSKMLERRLQTLGKQRKSQSTPSPIHADGFFRATGLQSSGSCIEMARTYFPPKPIAEFLIKTFFDYAQTNYVYFDEDAFREKFECYYSSNEEFTIHDAGWVCTLLMIFAIGTQFAYMQTKSTSTILPALEEIPDDHIGLKLYRFASRLMPDLITIASVETVQAFLLMGVYTLPIDTSGLAYTYFGLAIKMAIQNGMHRKFSGSSLNPRTVEMRNRIWWSAYSLESRISILHGRPVSVFPTQVDAPMPTDLPTLQPIDRISILQNFIASVRLTTYLANASDIIRSLRCCRRPRHDALLRRLAAFHHELKTWWDRLPTDVHCRDLQPDGPLFRCNVHLELYYTTTRIYTGRPFIILQTHAESQANLPQGDSHPTTPKIVRIVREDSLHAALRVIELCQLLQDTVSLSRISYTEFSACRIALLVLIAHSLNKSSPELSGALEHGMNIIRQICVGLESARSEVALIEALERARQRLSVTTNPEQDHADPAHPVSGYDQFKEWARIWQSEPSAGGSHNPVDSNIALHEQSHPSVPSFDGFFSSFRNELSEFAAIPGINGEFPMQNWMDVPQLGDPEWNLDQLP